MRILFGCEFYAPLAGGVQHSMRQVAERLVARGHEVTVATSALAARDFTSLNGVQIKGFAITGNLATGMSGEIDRYHGFILNSSFDVMMIKSVEQWTFDALWPILDRMTMQTVVIPVGMPRLYEPAYADYYRRIPDVLAKFNHLIFHASTYRDTEMAVEHGITNYSVIPNGGSEVEFGVEEDPAFRARHGILEHSHLLLTVGSFTGLKGHAELSKAFSLMDLDPGMRATLILNGNTLPFWRNGLAGLWSKFRSNDLRTAARKAYAMAMGRVGDRLIRTGKKQDSNKQVIVANLPRQELIQAYKAADLFVFASYVEYSPNVLYEAVASKTPFLSVPVGNSEEIAEWTGGGVICPAPKDDKGYTRVDPSVLAEHMARLIRDEPLRKRLGEEGHRRWKERFTWDKISGEYEALFQRLVDAKATAVRNVV